MLIDSKFVAYRSRFSSGTPLSYNEVSTSLFYNFFNTLLSCAKKLEINKCVLVFDYGDESIRKQEYPEYKNKKHKPTSEYDLKIGQLFKEEYYNLINWCDKIGFHTNYLEQYEADDLIALYCEKHTDEEIYIISKDEDLYQLLFPHVTIYDVDKKFKKNKSWFISEYGINPDQWRMIKAIGGCSSDNVKGVGGVGEETALKYLKELANPNQVKKIENNWHEVEQCLQVVTLPHPSLKNYKFKFKQSDMEPNGFIKFCQNNGFRQFLDHLWEFEKYFSIS